MNDVKQTLISQYANSPTIVEMIERMNDAIDPSVDFETMRSFCLDIDTAQGFGLDIIGKIVVIGRELRIPSSENYFGFSEGAGYFPFDDGVFFDEQSSTQSYLLTDDAYRQLIKVKMLANITATNTPSINKLLQLLFSGRGRCYVVDLRGMAMMYTFEFALQDYERSILTQSGALPNPGGVKVFINETGSDTFGFAESGDSFPFDDGVFSIGVTNAN